MNRRLLLPASALLAATCVLAADAFNIRPGLWNMTTTMTMAGAPLYIDGMPESARSEYAKQWAGTANKPITDTDDNCITAEDLRKANLFEDMTKGREQSCKPTITKQTATAMAGVLECKDAKTTTRTEMEYTAASPTTFKGKMKSTITSPNGTTTMSVDMTGKWVAASCPKDDESEDTDSED